MSEAQRYVLVSKKTGFIENVILWDGVSEWEPGPDFDCILEKDALKQGVTWAPPEIQEEEPEEE